MSQFIWESKVRDYELDSQGIVNNAVYLNYFEECRNSYAHSLGIDFHDCFHAGYSLVLSSTTLEYKRSLRGQMEFVVTATISEIKNKRIYFIHEIRRKQDDKLAAKALAEVACVSHETGRACMPEMLLDKLKTVLHP